MMTDCLNCILLFILLHLQVSAQHLKFVSASPGETIVLKYNSNALYATWFIPAHGAHKYRSVNMEDMYGQNRTWNIRRFAENAKIRNLKIANRLKIVLINSRYFLQVTNITSNDAGLYLCDIIIVNEAGVNTVKNWFIVQVKYSVVNYVNVNSGKTIVLKYNCTASSVDWNGPNHENKKVSSEEEKDMYGITRKWNVTRYTSNGHINPLLPHKERLRIVGNKTIGQFYLQIKNVSTYDAGLYNCDIFIINQTAVRETFIIQVNHVPDLLITFEPSMPIYEGSSLRLCCRSKKPFPNETIWWLNTKFGRQDRSHPSSACLHFVKTSRTDSGTYTCKAEYEGQKVTSNITINVLHIPDLFITFEPPMPIYEGSALRLCCIFNNSLKNATIGWFNTKICRQDLPNSSTVCLHFVKTSRNDSGIYTCKAEQKGHKLTENITLDVLPNFSLEENTLSSKDVAIIVLLVLNAVILVVTGIYVLNLKRSYRKRLIETIHIQAEEDTNADSAHYSDIIEVNNVLTTSQENNSETYETDDIDAENIGIAQMPEEHNSSLSNSNSDTTEYLNSGYEHPYTTLVANNGDKDEHSYDVSKQNSAIENILPSINDATEPFVEIIEQASSLENVQTHLYANESKENVKLNDNVKDLIAKDNGSHPSSFLSKKHEPEYINLSLKQ